jgi:cell filamentation protein
MSRISIRFCNDREVRAIRVEEQATWWFSVVDVVGEPNEEDDHTKAGNYWRWLKRKLLKENVRFVRGTHRLKLTASDGK